MTSRDDPFRRNRALSDFLSMIREIVEDDRVDPDEARRLAAWIEENPGMEGVWPVGDIARKVRVMIGDGELSQGERKELLDLLRSAGGTEEPRALSDEE